MNPLVRVASVPADHVYVRHLGSPDGDDGVVRLPEVRGDGPPGAPWWPPPMLTPAWIEANADRFDVLHVHFGFDAVPAAELQEAVDALRAVGRPLVYTVHDLRNPHHRDQRRHREALDVLVPAADQVVTLTPGAARQIAATWGRDAAVVPHPHVVPVGRLDAPRPTHEEFVIGLHLKSLRANMFSVPFVDALAAAARPLAGARVRVDVHEVVDDPDHHAHQAGLLDDLRRRAETGAIDLRIHPFLDDDAFLDHLAGLDVSVLPYRFGTHSGWLEACVDLGTAVIAPTCGWYHEQQPVHRFASDADGFDAEQLAAAVRAAYEGRPALRRSRAERLDQRRAIAAAHRALYEACLLAVHR